MGAQCWRIISICRSFGLTYLHNRIKELTSTPLDPYQTYDQRQKFIERIEKELFPNFRHFTFSRKDDSRIFLQRDYLSVQGLLKYIFRSLSTGERYCIYPKNSGGITDKFPHVLTAFQRLQVFEQHTENEQALRVVIHFRNHLQPSRMLNGMVDSRWLSPEYFVEQFQKFVPFMGKNRTYYFDGLSNEKELFQGP